MPFAEMPEEFEMPHDAVRTAARQERARRWADVMIVVFSIAALIVLLW
jgi:hypothetical protein